MEPELETITIGVDIGNLPFFLIHGENDSGDVVVKKELLRTEMDSYFSEIFPCIVGFLFNHDNESTVRFWKRKLESYNHVVTLMTNDFINEHGHDVDAKGICKALRRTVS
jgi:transposase